MTRNAHRLFCFPFILLLALCSCENEQSSPQASIIFGEAYGFCTGDCAHFFQINGDKIFQDDLNRYFGEYPTFSSTHLPSSKFELAKSLLDNFPNYLLDHPNQTYGCPDCADQGGVHIFYKAGSMEYFWHIDTFIDNQPIEIRQYINQVREVTNQLKN